MIKVRIKVAFGNYRVGQEVELAPNFAQTMIRRGWVEPAVGGVEPAKIETAALEQPKRAAKLTRKTRAKQQ